MTVVIESSDTYPILDEDVLLTLPKASKTQDLERMYTSPNSEDRVTWNVLRALQRTTGLGWWKGLVAAAEADAGHTARWDRLEGPPTVEFWRSVPTPPAYESASRQRMAASTDPAVRERAQNMRPVEGPTEVDLVFDSTEYLVFVEAKLHSDISPSTSHDPNRNQIVRNIDCLLEQCGDREPFFWMLVHNRDEHWLYSELIASYRQDPDQVAALLPHRDPHQVQRVVSAIAVVTWGDIAPLIPADRVPEDVVNEIEERIGGTGESTSEGTNGRSTPRREAMLPYANWSSIPPGLSPNDAVAAAIDTIDIGSMHHLQLGDLVPGIWTLEDQPIDRDHAPTIIRWRLLPNLPSTWRGLAATTVGELLDIDGVGVGKVRVLVEFAALRVISVPVDNRSATDTVDLPQQEIVEALKSIAAWGHSTGRENLLEALGDAAGAPSDSPVDAIALLSSIDLAQFAGEDTVADADPMVRAASLLDRFDDREMAILTRRVIEPDRSKRATLAAIADDCGITRERVRQIEKEIRGQLEGMLGEARYRPVQRLVRDIRSKIGRACPVSGAPPQVRPDDRHVLDELLLWFAGPYDRTDGWYVSHGSSLRNLVLTAFEETAARGIAARNAVADALVVMGIHEEYVEALIEASGLLTTFEDSVFIQPRTTAGRAEMQLRLHGRPMSYDELFSSDDQVENLASYRNAISAAPTLHRVGKDRIALVEWDGDEYPGVVPAMVEAIRDAGGAITLRELQTQLSDRFAISPASVSIYSSTSPLFVHRNGAVELRTYAEPYRPATDLTSTRNCFLLDGRWALRLTIDDDVLRGSGRLIPEAFAVYLGLQPLATKELRGPVRSVHSAWHHQPTLGSIRLGVLELGLDVGDYVFLRYRSDGTLQYVGLAADSLAELTHEDRARALVGSPTDGRPIAEVIASALDVEGSEEDLEAVLRTRGQNDLIEALQGIQPNT